MATVSMPALWWKAGRSSLLTINQPFVINSNNLNIWPIVTHLTLLLKTYP